MRYVLFMAMALLALSGRAGEAQLQPASQQLTRTQQAQVQAYEETLVGMKSSGSRIAPEQLFQRIYGYVAKGCASDATTNDETAQKLGQKALETAQQNREKAEPYALAAKAYHQSAEMNRKAMEAYRQANTDAMSAALAGLVQCEKRIEQITGRKPVRDWLTPDELAMAFAQRVQARKATAGAQR